MLGRQRLPSKEDVVKTVFPVGGGLDRVTSKILYILTTKVQLWRKSKQCLIAFSVPLIINRKAKVYISLRKFQNSNLEIAHTEIQWMRNRNTIINYKLEFN